MNRIILLRETWSHMASVSGFDPLCKALEEVCGTGDIQAVEVPVHVPPEPRRSRYLRRIGLQAREIPLQGTASSPWVFERHEWAAREVLKKAHATGELHILLTAGENQLGLRFRQAAPEVRKRLVVCLHQPPSWYRLHWRDLRDLDGLGALVCLCEGQGRFFTEHVSTPVLEIRHGVCHDFFTPPTAKENGSEMRLLFVGQWLRDFRTLRRAMELIWTTLPNVTLDCVVPRSARSDRDLSRLALDPRARWHSELTANELRSLYQNSALLLLPILDGTANNAIVEAMACGLPVVSTATGGMADYLPMAGGELCAPHDAPAHARAVLTWLADSERRARAARVVRKEAETHLNWRTIAEKLVTGLSALDRRSRE